jgi:Methyltransferase domain
MMEELHSELGTGDPPRQNDETSKGIGIDLNRKRHGARNQHKMKYLVKWLHDTFFDSTEAAGAENHNVVLDVAGGKGELAARLTMCHGMTVTMVDPRPADIPAVYLTDVVPRLPNKWQKRLEERCAEDPRFIQKMVDERFQQLVMYFTEETVVKEAVLRQAIQNCTLMIGMHADSATECIVDVALRHQKAFVVVPCCVFPNLFQQRFIIEKVGGNKVPVRSYEQFCKYLLQKDSRFRMEVLPFDGRNIAIWWDGKS